MSSYLSVSSNDTLGHKALQGSPETLCGKPVTDVLRPREIADLSTQDTQALVCDVCDTLSGGGLLKETTSNTIVEAGRDCPYCEDGIDSDGNECWNCAGTGWLDDGDDSYYTDLQQIGVDDSNLKGTKVAQSTGPTSSKVATNWTRDGVAIENGFEVQITKEQAAITPFLDRKRVGVSEKRECPDCQESHWLDKIASCDSCGTLKCTSCFEEIGASKVFGMCKLCASADSDWMYEANDEEYSDPDRYLSYLLREDTEAEADPLFLPNSFE